MPRDAQQGRQAEQGVADDDGDHVEEQQGRTEHRHQRPFREGAEHPGRQHRDAGRGEHGPERSAVLAGRPAPAQRAYRPAPGAVLLKEEPDHAYEQQGVSGVGDAHAPGVAAHGQDASLQVFVVIRLVETPAPVLEDMVHRDGDGPPFADQLGHVIRDVPGSGIVFDTELLQFQRERKRTLLSVIVRETGCLHAVAEVDLAADAGQVRDQRSREDQHQGQVEPQGEGLAEGTAPPKQPQSGNGRQAPEREEDGMVVNAGERHLRPVQAFYHGGGGHQDDEHGQRAEAQPFEGLRSHR